jgi:hypothetical protein
MKKMMLRYADSAGEGVRRVLFGAAAMVATAATLGLTVLAPVAAAPGEPVVALVNYKRLVLGPTDVAIVPSSVEVIAIRMPHTDPLAEPVAAARRG